MTWPAEAADGGDRDETARRECTRAGAGPSARAGAARRPRPGAAGLQRTSGNRAVQRLVLDGFGTAPALTIQRAKINPEQVEVTRPAKGRGVILFKNPEGYFPYFE